MMPQPNPKPTPLDAAARIELLQAALNVALYWAESCPDADPNEIAGCRAVLDEDVAR